VLDERVLGRGGGNTTYWSVLLNGKDDFDLLVDGTGTVAVVAEDEEVGLAAGVEDSGFVVVGVRVVCINFFALPSNLARRLEVWESPPARCAVFGG
jgi:hypothetical protein